ncbi:TetR/AcrR family transcriptional regulator [Paenibacillus sp. J22TS3]|uniref:TetR/AcrR family transcriptional regulator n=1 Tax=Paenibacillus TaxID=44249 RepID=UPI001B1D38A4|nr:TetR/AcrR family transcriptional regulator [Paenibacillus sp. J22TS3]GIP20887.1 putative HTH-type transcriptional regulator YdgC [Paenibacillus sp. J22TS3]
MVKSSKEKGKASKARLLTLAASEFSRRGYHDTKISDIVAAAGLTQPAFYLYFSSKEAIFIELTQAFHNRMRTLIENSLLDSAMEQENVFEHIKTKLKMFFEFLAMEPDLTRIGLFVNPNRAQIRADMVRMVRDNLVKEQQSGYFRSDLDMEFVAECLVSMIEQLTETRLLPGLSSAGHLATQIVDLLLNGMIAE